MGAFWFVSALFLTQQLYNLLQRLSPNAKAWAIVGLYIGAVVWQFSGPRLPWALNTVPYLILFFYLGDLLKDALFRVQKIWLTLAIAAVALATTLTIHGEMFRVSIKSMHYGAPLLSVVIAMGFIYLSFLAVRILAKVTILKTALEKIGQASLTILFTHIAIFGLLHQKAPFYAIVAATLGGGWLIDWALRKNKRLNQIFRGKKQHSQN